MNPNNYDGERVVLLAGESFQRLEKLSEIIDCTVDEITRDFNYDVFYPNDFEKEIEIFFSKFFLLIQTYPMIGNRRVVVIRYFDKLEKSTRMKVCELLMEVPETTLVIVEGIDAKLSPKPKSNHFKSYIFPFISKDDMPQWIKVRFKKNGKTINDNAITVLINNDELVLGRLENMIDKICISTGDRKNIKAVDVLMVERPRKPDRTKWLGKLPVLDKLSSILYILYNEAAIEKAAIERERELKKKLYSLAEDIQSKLPDTPEENRLLTSEMIEILVDRKPITIEGFLELPYKYRKNIFEEGKFINDVFNLIKEFKGIS